MRAFIQRCRGDVAIGIEKNGQVTTQKFSGVGLVVLLGWLESDLANPKLADAETWILSRILGLRIFEDAQGKMNLSLADYAAQNQVASGILWVSQFTLAAELESGFRPSFTKAMNPAAAQKRYDEFCLRIKSAGDSHQHLFGEFGALMHLSFTNWGPVSILLEK